MAEVVDLADTAVTYFFLFLNNTLLHNQNCVEITIFCSFFQYSQAMVELGADMAISMVVVMVQFWVSIERI